MAEEQNNVSTRMDKRLKLLLIEDECAIRESLSQYLQSKGFEVIEAENGQQGIDYCRKIVPQLVITDLAMPLVSGEEVIHTISSEFPDIPIIVLSTNDDIEKILSLLRCGAWDYITKPINDFAKFDQIIDVQLRKSEEQRNNKDRLIHLSHLEKEVHRRTAFLDETNSTLYEKIETFQQAKDDVAEAEKVKHQFLDNVTHELRTPLNGIIGMSSILLDTKLERAELEKCLKTIYDSGVLLLDLVNHLLDFSHLDKGDISINQSSVNLADELRAITNIFRGAAAEKNLNLEYLIGDDVPQIIKTDSKILRQILSSLVDNSVKFTKFGFVEIQVKLEKSHGLGTKLHFMVNDSGIGIAKHDKKKIFHSFTQGDGSQTREIGGLGLGLCHCAKLVNILGGHIWFESIEEVGSIFNFAIEQNRGS